MQKILSKEIVTKIREELTQTAASIPQEILSESYLAAVLCSDDSAAESYLGAKLKIAAAIGVNLQVFNFSDVNDEAELLAKVKEIDSDPKCKSIIIELPLKSGMDELKFSNALGGK